MAIAYQPIALKSNFKDFHLQSIVKIDQLQEEITTFTSSINIVNIPTI